MGWSLSKVQLPVGIPERTRQHCGRCAELNITCLNLEAMRSILHGATLGAAHRVEGYDPAVVKGDHDVEKEVHITAGWVLVQMHMTDWAEAQGEDPVLNTVLDWLEAKRRLI